MMSKLNSSKSYLESLFSSHSTFTQVMTARLSIFTKFSHGIRLRRINNILQIFGALAFVLQSRAVRRRSFGGGAAIGDGAAIGHHKPQQSHQHLERGHVLSELYFACTTSAVHPGKSTPPPAGAG
ncbi:MAG: hypothetical protein ACWM0S_03400 [Schaalia turicensis]